MARIYSCSSTGMALVTLVPTRWTAQYMSTINSPVVLVLLVVPVLLFRTIRALSMVDAVLLVVVAAGYYSSAHIAMRYIHVPVPCSTKSIQYAY